MKMFLWGRTSPVTDSFHAEGGLCIVAKDLESARRLWVNSNAAAELDNAYNAVKYWPDRVFELVGDQVPEIFVFPDVGCCQ